ncbi:MAG: hypothetical protein JNK08_09270 [Sediminibacterium sp.]|nr:hypothetical protein [Sediminibacterium sp.]
MIGAETVILGVAKFLGGQLVKWGYKKATKNENDEYTQELYEIIVATINVYEAAFPVQENSQIPFYKSEVLLKEFLQYRFHKELDKEKIKEAIAADKRILPPSPHELTSFYEYFNHQIQQSSTIKTLDISVNFKEEVFNISVYLKEFRNELNETLDVIKRELHLSNVAARLAEEWNKQLDESAENLRSFKAKTALERLENLEKRIIAESINNDTLFAKLYSLQAEALGLLYGMDGSEEKNRQAKLFIRIHTLNPTNLDYKSNAALAYLTLEEPVRSMQLADELLERDEFNLAGWLIKCFIADAKFRDVLPAIPLSLKKTDIFKLNLYRWIASKQFIKNYRELEEIGLNLGIDLVMPIKISYKNLHYLHLASVYLMNVYFSRHPSIVPILEFPEAKENPEFEYAYKILELCAEKLKGTEIQDKYLFYEFHYHCNRYVLLREEKDLIEMERIFQQLGDDKETEVVVRMMQAYNCFDRKEYYIKALAIAEEYSAKNPPAELLLIMQAGTASAMGDQEKQIDFFLQYLRFQSIIDEHVFFNFISFVRNNTSRANQLQKDEVALFVDKAQYEKPVYHLILQLLCSIVLKTGNRNIDEIEQLISEARKLVDLNNEPLCVQLALAYVLTGKLEAAMDFIKSYQNFDEFNESYVLYCKILYELPTGDKIELLALLKKYREQFHIDYVLLQIEMQLAQLQGQNREFVRLAKKGHETFPKSEFFVRALFISLDRDLQTEEIKKLGTVAGSYVFKDEQTVVVVAQILIKVELFSEAIELLYKYASNSGNTLARQTYFMMSHTFPAGSMKEFEEVQSGMYVKYEVSGVTKIIEITEENKDKHPYNLFLRKKVGETFSFQKPFSDLLEFFKVVRIMDKYLALFEQVMEDSEDPLSNMPMRKIEFKGNSVEGMHASLKEAFGITGSLQQERSEKEYEKYFNGTSSYGEITNSIFRQNFIDAYFILSNNNGKPFRALSPALGHSQFTDQSQFIIDPTSLCLFYMLEKETSVVFTRKFWVSPFLRQHVVWELEKTKKEEYNLSVSITMDKVTPHVYDDQFKARRINTFEGLVTWLDNHCIVAEIPERLQFITALESDKQDNLFFNVYLDNRLLTDRPDHFLLTNDLMYIRSFATDRAKAISPICYLNIYQREKQKEYTNHMLQHYYVGIPVSASIMNEEFFRMLSGQENRFMICLENLKYNWNPESKNIGEVIFFIKNLYVNSVVNAQTRNQWTFAVLQALTTGMDDRLLNIVSIVIKREFRLLSLHEMNVLLIFKQITGK